MVRMEQDEQLKLFEEKTGKPPKNSDVGCVFCGIASGEVQSLEVYRNDFTVAFLDRKPLFRGHTLVIPVKHFETLPDLPSDLVGKLFSTVRLMSKAVSAAIEADGTFVAINNRVSQSVPHLHVHVVPRRMHDGLRGFFWPRESYREGEASIYQEKIRKSTSNLAAEQDAKSI